MRSYSISLLFVVQVWNIKFYQCLELVQITLPVIKITHYHGNNATSYYILIVTIPGVRHLVTGGGIRVIPHLFEICWSLILVQHFYIFLYILHFLLIFGRFNWKNTMSLHIIWVSPHSSCNSRISTLEMLSPIKVQGQWDSHGQCSC